MVFHSGLLRPRLFHRFDTDDVLVFVLELAGTEINHIGRVHRFTEIADLEMQVATRRAPCVTAQTDYITGGNRLVLID